MAGAQGSGDGPILLARSAHNPDNDAQQGEIRMRLAIAALALALAACDGANDASTETKTGETASGYTMEIRATEAVQTYVVIAPDGRTVGAQAAEGASALMDTGRAQALAAEPPPEGEEVPEVMSLRLPGFEMSIGGTEDDANGDHGSVNLRIGGEQNVIVRANEGGPGDADDSAFVRITGADEAAAREFINDAEELSPEVKTQMLGALGL
jgi:hypothetical protein